MMIRRPDSGIWTYTGRYVYPLYPRVEDIDIADIAHALSNLCRYTGHVSEFYSVAEHSVRVFWSLANSSGINTWTKFETSRRREYLGLPLRWALLHDASEAYLNDWSRPLKHHWLFGLLYRHAERRLMRVICDKFKLPHEEPAVIKIHDHKLLLAEQRDLMPHTTPEWGHEVSASTETIIPLTPRDAEARFLQAYNYLYGGQIERQNTTKKEAVSRVPETPSFVDLASMGSQQL